MYIYIYNSSSKEPNSHILSLNKTYRLRYVVDFLMLADSYFTFSAVNSLKSSYPVWLEQHLFHALYLCQTSVLLLRHFHFPANTLKGEVISHLNFLNLPMVSTRLKHATTYVMIFPIKQKHFCLNTKTSVSYNTAS